MIVLVYNMINTATTRATWTAVLLLLCRFAAIRTFNLENRLPIIKFGDNPTSYFGYSVAMHTISENNFANSTKWLLVGAPLDKNLQPGTNHSGALYKCPITQRTDDCEQVITDGRRLPGGAYESSYDSDEELLEPSDEEIKDGQWLGVTVRSQGLGSKVLVCAHRYITKVRENRWGQGLCYVLTNDLKYDEVYEPCKGRSVQRAHEDYGFCQAGTSGAILDDNTMVLGTPGPYTWRGTVFVTEIGGEYLDRDKNMYYGDHSDNSSPVDKYSYLGMSVTGGRYFGHEISYAAGAPRAKGHGQVVIFNKAHTNPIPVQMIINGEQFASSFGYELTTADVNGDLKADLIVAAPFYFTKTEGGAVYVYQNDNDTLPLVPTLKLTGTLESRFGLALANIGDINKDNCEDVAIGAPYEGDGVVYIYLGSRSGLNAKPSQRIAASDLGLLPRPLKTFGSSLAGNTDLDGNSYPDVLVGAYDSAATVALLSRPIISIQTSYRPGELKNIDPTKQGCLSDAFTNLTCFAFEACCSIDQYAYELSPTNKDLRLTYTVEAETFAGNKKFSRVFFERKNKRSNFIQRQVSVPTNGRLECHRVTGYIKENTRDIQSPIRFRLNYTIVERRLEDSGLKALNPILDQTKADVEFEGTFQKDCGDDDVCESNVLMIAALELNIEKDNYALILGEKDEIRVNVNISNTADSAYEAQLFIVHQKSVSYIAATKTSVAMCNRFNETVVACSLGNPMRRGYTAQVSIRFDPSAVELDERQLTFDVFVNTTSKLIGAKPEARLNVRVVKRAKLSLHGMASPEQSFYSGEVKKDSKMMEMEDVGSPVKHIYQIYNDGPWKAPKILMHIYWPYQLYSERDKKDKWLLYLEEIPRIEIFNAGTQGKCSLSPDYVNPLNLHSKANANSAPEQLRMGPVPFSRLRAFRNRSSSINGLTYVDKPLVSPVRHSTMGPELVDVDGRSRRDTIAAILRPERFMDGREVRDHKNNIVELDCNKATANCIKIECEIFNMLPKTEVSVHVRARLWNSTLVSEYPRVDLLKIVSVAYVKIPLDYKVEQLNDANVAVETSAYPELLDQQRSEVPWFIFVIAVVVGILALAAFIYCMHKCGFFKRRRPDPTLSGNLEKSEEKPFLNQSRSNSKSF